MTQQNRSKFDMCIIRRRAKKAVKKRHKKSIKLSDVDKIWAEYVEYAIIRDVIKYGYSDIEGHFRTEIVGREVAKDKKIISLLIKGLNIGKNGLRTATKWKDSKYIYKIKVIDKNCKGVLIFEADKKFRKRVAQRLKEPGVAYKIEK